MLALALAVVSGATMGANSDVRRWTHGKLRHMLLYVLYRPDDAEKLGDGHLAKEILLHSPMGLAEDTSGNVYVSDRGRRYPESLRIAHYRGLVVWKIDPGGRAHVVAGTGYRGDAPIGVSARDSDLGAPEGVAVDLDGRIYVADHTNNAVLRIDANSHFTRFAGTGERGYGGDGGPADAAMLNQPYDVRFDSDGNLYIADYGNHRIRRVSPDGIIATIAGIGSPGYSGDGGPATAAQLRGPYGILVGRDGRLLIADSENNAVRAVDGAGIITTIAGTGEQGFSGDGGPARSARLNYPESLAMDQAGRIFLGDEHNFRIRKIDPDGTIDTYLGTGVATGCPDGAARTECGLNPQNMVLRADGSMLVTDRSSRLVLRVAADGTVTRFAGHRFDESAPR
jgi:sugar lactone lactonase YvrE